MASVGQAGRLDDATSVVLSQQFLPRETPVVPRMPPVRTLLQPVPSCIGFAHASRLVPRHRHRRELRPSSRAEVRLGCMYAREVDPAVQPWRAVVRPPRLSPSVQPRILPPQVAERVRADADQGIFNRSTELFQQRKLAAAIDLLVQETYAYISTPMCMHAHMSTRMSVCMSVSMSVHVRMRISSRMSALVSVLSPVRLSRR